MILLQNIEDLPSSETLNWADGILIVYSITDRNSFSYAKRVGINLICKDCDTPIYLAGNKNDMVHLRQVKYEEGMSLAKDLDCNFSEVAAAEQVNPVAMVFQDLCKTVSQARRKSKHSLLDLGKKMLGTRSSNCKLYTRGKSDSALPKD